MHKILDSIAITCLIAVTVLPARGQHGHGAADLVIVADGPGTGAQLEIGYPIDMRTAVRVTPVDPVNFPGLFSATTPGFVPGQGNNVDEHELAVPTEIEVELVARRGAVSFTVPGNGTIASPGEAVVLGTHSCRIDTDMICENGSNDGTVCASDFDCTGGGTCTAICEPESSFLHRHGEFVIDLMTADSHTFGEGEITFRIREGTGTGVGYTPSDPMTLRISNGLLPALEPASEAEASASHKCRRAVAKALLAHSKKTHQLLGKCLDAIFAAEELGKSQSVPVKACDVDASSDTSLKARLAADLAKRITSLDKVCDKGNDGSFAPFTASNLHTYLGMGACRSQELVGATYNNATAEMVEVLSTCDDNLCVAGPNKGLSCQPLRCSDTSSNPGLPCNDDFQCPGGACTEADDCDVKGIEEQIAAALPCLKMSQVEH